MKHHSYLLLLLLLTISVGRSYSYGHGVKGSINKSYSSSSASASSSAYSSSYSSGPIDSVGSINDIKPSSGAFSTAFSSAGSDGSSAKAGSGAFAGAGSGAFSGSGSFSGAGSNSQSGSYSGSGSLSGSGAYNGETESHNTGPGHIPVAVSGSGAISGSGTYTSGAGSHNLGPGLASASGSSHANSAHANSGSNLENDHLNLQISGTPCSGSSGCSITGNQHHSGSGILVGIGAPGQDSDKILPANGANSHAGANGNNIRLNINNNPNKVYVNDFQIPEEYSPKTQYPQEPKPQFPGPQGSIYDSKPAQQSGGTPPQQQHTYGQSVSNQNSYAGSNAGSFKPGGCKSCKGPFPGPKGNIHDYKPVPQGGGGPPAWVPEQQTQPPLVRPPIDISKFPGSPGSIHDSKPVTSGGKIPVGVIPVIVGGPHYNQGPHNQPTYNQGPHNQHSYNQGPQNQPTYNHGPQNTPAYNQELPQPKPGAIAATIIGKLPGPTGNIHSSVDVGKHVIQQIPVSTKPGTYDQKPLPSPVQPGNIHNNKPISGHGCVNGQCINQPDFGSAPNNKPGYPDCTHGQCDEFGGRLGCHGDDCFGPGRKPSYVHSGSDDKTQSNSNSHNENGNINIDFNHPTPGSYKPDCSKGQCNINGAYHPEKPISGLPGKTCSGFECLDHQGPIPGNYKPDCSRGQCNINGAYHPEKPISGSPGKTCSGFECLDHQGPQVNIPVAVIPEPIEPEKVNHKISPDHPKLDFDIDLRQKPDNYEPIYEDHSNNDKHTSSNSNANAHSSNSQEKIDVHIDQQPDRAPNVNPIEVDYPPNPPTQYNPKGSSTNKPNNEEVKPGGSRDFVLPGNKPYHRHPVKPHHPSHQDHPTTPTHNDHPTTSHNDESNPNYENHPKAEDDRHPHPIPGSTYYKCTGESCELPKPGESQPHHPSKTYYTCTGSSCPLPHPTPNGPQPSKPGCQGSQCGAGGKDRLFPPPFVPPTDNNGPSVSPVIVPVLIDVPPQENQNHPRPGNQESRFGEKYSGSGSAANAGSDSYQETGDHILGTGHLPLDDSLKTPYDKNNGCSSGTCQLLPGLNSQGFVSGNVVVQKSDGHEVPVVDFHIPNSQPGEPCSGGKCSFPSQPVSGGQHFGGGNSGSYTGYSGVQPCTRANCRTASQPVSGGAYSGSVSGGQSGNSVSPCGNSNCGHGINSVNFGGHSGAQAGSFSGAFGGVKGGTHIPNNSGSYSGSGVSGSSSFSGASSGAFSGSNAGSFSSAGSGNGPDSNLKSLKDILSQSLKYSGLEGGIPGPFGAGSFAQSGASSHGSSSAYSGAFSSSGSY